MENKTPTTWTELFQLTKPQHEEELPAVLHHLAYAMAIMITPVMAAGVVAFFLGVLLVGLLFIVPILFFFFPELFTLF